MSENDSKKANTGRAEPELGTAKAGIAGPNRKPPPSPKKIYESLGERLARQSDSQKHTSRDRSHHESYRAKLYACLKASSKRIEEEKATFVIYLIILFFSVSSVAITNCSSWKLDPSELVKDHHMLLPLEVNLC